ncbi:hypothetical protein QMO56_11315 [Roseomonas sp. E05]|uniref:hypothetical protein n=1 Tax=Roseomonas sp. E05 TaxID=3046310 RepID=UPI0024B89984|nr:hypothetical protein [Roseomonas sp. E05]MDJ0388702.1 hypothetical protein [Roseomonas sp. E05]
MTLDLSTPQAMPASRLRPAVASKSFEATEPGDIVALVDGGSERFGMVGAHLERGGTRTLVMVYMRDASGGGPATVAWEYYEPNQTVLSFGKKPFFSFDPRGTAAVRAHLGPVPTGALIVGRSGTLLTAQHAAATGARAAYFNIASGELVTDAARSGDVAIKTWELHLPIDGQPSMALFRFGSAS